MLLNYDSYFMDLSFLRVLTKALAKKQKRKCKMPKYLLNVIKYFFQTEKLCFWTHWENTLLLYTYAQRMNIFIRGRVTVCPKVTWILMFILTNTHHGWFYLQDSVKLYSLKKLFTRILKIFYPTGWELQPPSPHPGCCAYDEESFLQYQSCLFLNSCFIFMCVFHPSNNFLVIRFYKTSRKFFKAIYAPIWRGTCSTTTLRSKGPHRVVYAYCRWNWRIHTHWKATSSFFQVISSRICIG